MTDLYVASDNLIPREITDMIVVHIGIQNLINVLKKSNIDTEQFFTYIIKTKAMICGKILLRSLLNHQLETNNIMEPYVLKIYYQSNELDFNLQNFYT